jgi:hypothetical protein
MAASPDGIRSWPASPDVLADVHKCPGCFTVVSVPVCPVCGFVLTDPRAAEVLALGRTIVARETERQALIEQVRLAYGTAAPAALSASPVGPAPSAPPIVPATPSVPAPAVSAALAARGAPAAATAPVGAPAPAVPVTSAATVPAAPVGTAPAGRPAAPPTAPPSPPLPTREPRPPRRRLSVPILLLIVGVSLVGVAAVFFLVYAWFTWGIAVRALIIGAITVATIALASLLRRRSLTVTAEGLAVLGVILLGLDAWAVRANDFFGTAQLSATLYAGIGALTVGLLCRVWARLSRLRSPDIASVLALPIGLGLLIAGLTAPPPAEAIVVGLLGASVGGLAHALPAPWSAARARPDAEPERITLAVVGVAALVPAAIVAAFASPDDPLLPLWSGGAIVALGAAHAFLLRPRAEQAPLAASGALFAVASGLAAAVAAGVGWQIALRSDESIFPLLAGPVIAVGVAVLLDRRPARLGTLVAARITAAVVGALSLVAALVVWMTSAAQAFAAGWTAWQTDAFAAPAGQVDGAVYAATGGALIAALLFLAPTLRRPGWRDARMPVAGVVLLVGVAVLAVPSLLVAAAALVAVVATLALTRPALRTGAAVTAGVAAATAFTAGTTTPWLWLIGVVVAVGVPIAAQIIVRPDGGGAVALPLTAVGVAAVAALLAPAALGAALDAPANPAVTPVLLQWLALVAVACAVVLPAVAGTRSTLAFSGYALWVASLVDGARDAIAVIDGFPVDASPVATELGEPLLAVVRSAALLALLSLIALRRTRVPAAASLTGALLVAPVSAATTSAVLQVARLEEHGASAVATVGAAATVTVIAAAWSLVRPAPAAPPPAADPGAARPVSLPSTRALVDAGAAVTALTLVWGVGEDFRGMLLAVVAVGLAAASASRGWAAPAGPAGSVPATASAPLRLPSTRALGISTAHAPRRLLAWPALGFATAALWSALGQRLDAASLPVEAFVLPPAIALLVFAVSLVWLRREGEAAVALTLSLLFGLAAPALAGWSGSPVRGTVVALVSAAVGILLLWTPAARALIPARAGAVTALFTVALVCLERAIDDRPSGTAWLVLLVGTAYASALGATRPLRGGAHRSVFAAVVPAAAVVAASVAGMFVTESRIVVGIALVLLAALHIASAAFDRDPFGPVTRGTTVIAAAAFAIAGFVSGAATVDGVPVVELVSLPVAGTILAGSAVAQWRVRNRTSEPAHVRSDAELLIWLAGLAVAIVPSVIAPVEPVRTWLAVVVPLAAALVAVVVPTRSLHTLRMSSAALLTIGALAMAVRVLSTSRDAGLAEPAAIAAGAGALLVAVAMVWRSPLPMPLATLIASAGGAVLVATVVVFGDGATPRTAITATIAATLAVGGAAVLGLPRWRGVGATLAVAGTVAALAAIGTRFLIVAPSADTSIEPDLWAALAVGVIAAVGIMALRATASTPVARPVATAVGVGFSVALVLFAGAEVLLLGYGAGEELRAVVTMTALSVAGVGGVVTRDRLGLAPAITSAVAAAGVGVVALMVFGVSPVELVTAPPAMGLVALGTRTLRRDPRARTWPNLGPGLALLTLPSLAYDFFGETELWRVVALGVLAVGLVVVGAVRRLQAPLVLGSVVLLVHATAQLWPWISTAYEYVPWWLWLGIGGALLIFLAARYEKNMRALRTGFTAVSSLR